MIEIHHVRDEENLRRAYEDIYGSAGIRHTDSFYHWILGLIGPQPGKRFLDIACGQGVLPVLAASRGLEAHGLDLSAYAVKLGLGQDADLLVANGENLPYSENSFHYVTNIGSLEHYVDPVAGIREISRVLSHDGRACILLPNTFSLLGNVLYAWHNGRTADDGQPIQRYAARYEWEAMLEAGGLSVIRTHKYECEFPRSLGDLALYLQRPKSLLRLVLSPFVPLNLANSFVYTCKKGNLQA